MYLVPFVQYRAPRIEAHPHTAHLVDIQPRRLVISFSSDVFKTCTRKHLCQLLHVIFLHLLVVIIIIDGDFELWHSPCVFLVWIERYKIGCLRNSLAHHMRAYMPWSVLLARQACFKIFANSFVIMFIPPVSS